MSPGQITMSVIGIIVVIAGAYYSTALLARGAGRTQKGRLIQVHDRFSLSKDKTLCIVEVNGRIYIVAITNGGAALLDSIPKEEFEELKGHGAAPSFEFRKALKKSFPGMFSPPEAGGPHSGARQGESRQASAQPPRRPYQGDGFPRSAEDRIPRPADNGGVGPRGADSIRAGQPSGKPSHSGQAHSGQVNSGQAHSGQAHSGQAHSGQAAGKNRTSGWSANKPSSNKPSANKPSADGPSASGISGAPFGGEYMTEAERLASFAASSQKKPRQSSPRGQSDPEERLDFDSIYKKIKTRQQKAPGEKEGGR